MCYDQEPLLESSYDVLKQIKRAYSPNNDRSIILLNTESNSQIKNKILEDLKFGNCNYFFHIFAASDWYRGYQYCSSITSPRQRKINKTFITFNRITGNSRAYRSLFVAELAKNNLLSHGYISYSKDCPEHGHYQKTIFDLVDKHNLSYDYVLSCKEILDQIPGDLRIDSKDHFIPNGSQVISALNEMMDSFVHVVTETCFWETKEHLTEKIFKPIVTKQPFILLGCANNLHYLKKYGFKTFDSWWDESYDTISDPIKRIQAVVKILKQLSELSSSELESMLRGMNYILEHNFNLFYDQKFIAKAWDDLKKDLTSSLIEHPPRWPGGTPILSHLYIDDYSK